MRGLTPDTGGDRREEATPRLRDRLFGGVSRGERAILAELRHVDTMLILVLGRQELLEHLVRDIRRKEGHVSIVIDLLRVEVASVKQATSAVLEKLGALIQRLADNPTADEVAEITNDLRALTPDLQNVGTTLDSIDPDVPGGSVDETDGATTPGASAPAGASPS